MVLHHAILLMSGKCMIFSFIENNFFRKMLNLPRPDIIIVHLKSRTLLN